MMIKEKRWLSRLVAMLCVLTMVVGVLTPASVGVAVTTTYNETVKKIVLPSQDGVVFYDASKANMEDGLFWDETAVSDGYKYKKDENGNLNLIPIGEQGITNRIVFYVSGLGSSEMKSDIDNMRVVKDSKDSNLFKVQLNLAGVINEEVNISIDKKYTISFPAFDDYYKLKADGISNEIREKEVNENSEFTFEAKATAENKSLIVKVNGVTQGGENTAQGYKKYILKNIDRNMTITFSLIDKTYSVTLPTPGPDAGYSVMANSSLNVTHGGTVSFYVNPEKGYKEPKVTIDDNNGELSKGINNLYVINNITGNISVNITSQGKNEYTVHFVPGTGYTITKENDSPFINDEVSVESGTPVNFKVVAEPGYEIKLVTANGDIIKASLNDDTYSVNVTENTIINVTSQKVLYDVSYTYDSPEYSNKYTVVGESGKYEYDTLYSFYVTPAEDYEAPQVTVNEDLNPLKPVNGVNGTQYVINIKKDTIIHITAGKEKMQTITFNTGTGYEFVTAEGEKVLSSSETVSYGKDYNFKVNLKAGYKQSKDSITVTVNDIKITPVEDVYTIPSIKSDQIVSVSGVQKDTYTVTLIDGKGYSLIATDGTKVTAGEKFRFKIDVKEGYDGTELVVKVNDIEEEDIVKDSNGYYSVEVDKDIVISVINIETIKFKVKGTESTDYIKCITPYGNECKDLDNLEYGKPLQFKVIPKEYYHVTNVFVDGQIVYSTKDGVYTVNNIISAPTITVETETNKLIVNYVDTKYLKNNETKVYTKEDDNSIKTVNPERNSVYKFNGWKNDEGRDVESIDIDQIKNQASAEITLIASWGLNKDNLEALISLKTEKLISDESDDKVTLTFKTILEVLTEAVSNLPIGEKDNIKVSAIGTLYSPDEIEKESAEKNLNTTRKNDGLDGGYTLDKINSRLYNYYKECNVSLNDLIELGSTYFKIFSKIDKSNVDRRYGLGWIELDVNGEKMIFTAEM